MRRFLFNAFLSVILCLTVCTLYYSCKEETIKEKAARIHQKVLSLDSHTDTPMSFMRGEFDLNTRHDYAKRGGGRVDFPRMREGGLDAVFFAVFTGQGPRTPEANEKIKTKALQIFKRIDEAVGLYPDVAEIALTSSDADRLKRNNKLAIYIGMENGYPVGNDLNML